MERVSFAKLRWSRIRSFSLSSSTPTLASTNGRHRSTARLAIAGGGSPVRRSRTMSPSTSVNGAWICSFTSPKPCALQRIARMAARFCFTPGIASAPIASTRACSAASKIALASPPMGFISRSMLSS